ELFSWANKMAPSWKWLYYEALTYWQHNQPEVARNLFLSCENDPDFAPFYLAKARLFREDPSIVQASVEKANALDPASWRIGMEMVNLYLEKNQPENALQVAEKTYQSHSGKCMVVLQYANVLKLNGKYAETLKTLSQLEMLPAESDKWSGDINAHALFRATNVLSAIDRMKAGKWGKALACLKDAETWPENLGWGEPYFPDNRLTQFFSAYCYEQLNDKAQVERSFYYIIQYKNPDGRSGPLGNKLSSLVKEGNRNYISITESLIDSQFKTRDIELLKAFQDIL
ncbi:MAG: hypothetical protein AMS26_17930, partial [Bacteroides sp. SM23_62]